MIEDATSRYNSVPICNVIVVVNTLRHGYITGLGQLYRKLFTIKEKFKKNVEENLCDIGILKAVTR